ncbi:type I-C CRISPR-associated protein Cas8c/Csd1 [Streptomyces johnsoniae]|uniref:Type I-C CRISPR-associated protein Cas8c/Csd1 n=1 Tax=Streptomyces johnsoniae TaxID=3075532 RepID=A0ABU2S6K9_9ACTN|nr:type I-C CRISPR-associated protein Cas8c/Csd1 [Streptomyces sp. DSM 41886]MDT0444301.1 type I-C CRISPR-associated protein Cas8c/Csd1 [Streptomyces sp. DSM 41886]
MLLQRLREYAERAAEDLPAEYHRAKVIDRVLRLSEDGRSAELEDRRKPVKLRAEALVEYVPHVQRSGTKVPPYLLVDTAEFVLGVPKESSTDGPSEKARAEAERRHAAYRELALRWADSVPDDPAAAALRTYLTALDVTRPALDGVDHKEMVAVRVGTRWLHALASAQGLWGDVVRKRKGGKDERSGLCLVCGEQGALLGTIPEPVKKGSVPTSGGSNEGQLVSINTAAQGRNGIQQLANTPICHRCGGRAMAALNHLLASPTQRRRFKDFGSLVWWTREAGEDSDLTPVLLDRPDEATIARLIDSLNDEPTPRAVGRVRPDAFYGLTIGLNNARIVVRDWIDVPVPEIKRTLGLWYQQHGVHEGWKRRIRHVPMWQMALACGRWDGERYARDSAPLGLETELMFAALHGGRLPARLLPLLVQRVHADRNIDAPRAALIRLALNRTDHYRKPEMPAALDETDNHPVYLWGRIFAVLEQIQRLAVPGLNTSLRDKYLPTAAAAPSPTMTQLLKNANGHLKRLRRDNAGAGVALETRLNGFLGRMPRGALPQHLNLIGQCDFFMGYHHQRQADFEAAAEAKAAAGGESQSPVPAQPLA